MKLELKKGPEPTAPLAVHARNVTSQSGEDGIIAHLSRVLQPSERYCVEFGAWDGRHFSNCHALITSVPLMGSRWRGLMIEANTEKFAALVQTYAKYPDVLTMNRLVDFDGPNRLDNILAEARAPANLGMMSIDIDGNDYHVWDALSAYRPEIVVIEFNPTVPNDVVFVQDKSFEINQGCSLLALIELGKQKGYELVATTPTNAFFVVDEKFPLLGIADNSINALHRPLQDGRIFHGYDGTIYVVGMPRILWKGIKVTSEDFQVLPKSVRQWGDAQK